MISLDTNILVRLVVADDPQQTRRVRKLLASAEAAWVTTTVLLETEWVLRYSYELDREAVNRSLLGILGLPNVNVGQPETVALALSWHAEGLDFADALHLAASGPASAFMSFDRDLARRAKKVEGAIAVEEP